MVFLMMVMMMMSDWHSLGNMAIAHKETLL